MEKIILGIDPGSYYTGFGVIKTNSNTNKSIYVASGVINLSKITEFDSKLSELYENICEVVNSYKPDNAVIEDLFVYKNVKSAIKLSHARAACILALANSGVKFQSFSPRYVKKAVVGHGGANKDDVQYMVKNILKLNKDYVLKPDAADALAIALSYNQSYSMFF